MNNTLILGSAIVALLASLWMRWRYKNHRLLELSRQLPGPVTLPVLGNAMHFICKPEEMALIIEKLLKEYGAWFRFWLGPELNVIISDPDDLKTILSNPKMSAKGPTYKYMASLLGEGILSGSGPKWRRHRKIANPNYGKRAIEGYEQVFNTEIDVLMETFRHSPYGRKIDVYHNIVRHTSYTVCQTLMGLSRDETVNLPHMRDVIHYSPKVYDVVFDRMTKWWYQIDPVFWLSSHFRLQTKFKKMMDVFSSEIVKHRRTKLEEDNRRIDLLDIEEDSSKNTEFSVIDRFILCKELNENELRDETFTIFTSSQEASAKISSSLILMMAYHPHCQEKLHAEIQSIVAEDRHVTDDDLKRMPYLDMAYKETLRLFPIGALLQRTVTEDIPFSKGVLPAGCSLTAPIFHLHRSPQFWDNPNAFNPERFTPENSKKRQPNCYIPFSVGPMDCLGRYFGTKLIKTICVRFLREFEVTAVNKFEDMRMNIAISASPIDGYSLIMKPRKPLLN